MSVPHRIYDLLRECLLRGPWVPVEHVALYWRRTSPDYQGRLGPLGVGEVEARKAVLDSRREQAMSASYDTMKRQYERMKAILRCYGVELVVDQQGYEVPCLKVVDCARQLARFSSLLDSYAPDEKVLSAADRAYAGQLTRADTMAYRQAHREQTERLLEEDGGEEVDTWHDAPKSQGTLFRRRVRGAA